MELPVSTDQWNYVEMHQIKHQSIRLCSESITCRSKFNDSLYRENERKRERENERTREREKERKREREKERKRAREREKSILQQQFQYLHTESIP